MDVVALKTPKLRGQAWVCFSEITAASNAVRQMQNFPFYDKPIVSSSILQGLRYVALQTVQFHCLVQMFSVSFYYI